MFSHIKHIPLAFKYVFLLLNVISLIVTKIHRKLLRRFRSDYLQIHYKNIHLKRDSIYLYISIKHESSIYLNKNMNIQFVLPLFELSSLFFSVVRSAVMLALCSSNLAMRSFCMLMPSVKALNSRLEI